MLQSFLRDDEIDCVVRKRDSLGRPDVVNSWPVDDVEIANSRVKARAAGPHVQADPVGSKRIELL